MLLYWHHRAALLLQHALIFGSARNNALLSSDAALHPGCATEALRNLPAHPDEAHLWGCAAGERAITLNHGWVTDRWLASDQMHA